MKFWSKYKIFHSQKGIWKHLWNGKMAANLSRWRLVYQLQISQLISAILIITAFHTFGLIITLTMMTSCMEILSTLLALCEKNTWANGRLLCGIYWEFNIWSIFPSCHSSIVHNINLFWTMSVGLFRTMLLRPAMPYYSLPPNLWIQVNQPRNVILISCALPFEVLTKWDTWCAISETKKITNSFYTYI